MGNKWLLARMVASLRRAINMFPICWFFLSVTAGDAIATLGVDWDEIHGEGRSHSDWPGVILGLYFLLMFVSQMSRRRLASLAAFCSVLGGFVVLAMNNDSVFAWALFLGGIPLATYLCFSGSPNAQETFGTTLDASPKKETSDPLG